MKTMFKYRMIRWSRDKRVTAWIMIPIISILSILCLISGNGACSIFFVLASLAALFWEFMNVLSRYTEEIILKNKMSHLCFGSTFFLPLAYVFTIIYMTSRIFSRPHYTLINIMGVIFIAICTIFGWVTISYAMDYCSRQIRN